MPQLTGDLPGGRAVAANFSFLRESIQTMCVGGDVRAAHTQQKSVHIVIVHIIVAVQAGALAFRFTLGETRTAETCL